MTLRPFAPTQLGPTRAPVIPDSTEAVPLALTTTNVLAKERATTATFMPRVLTPLGPSIARAIPDSTALELLALVFLCFPSFFCLCLC